MENRARDFALNAHGDQQYGDSAYIFHLDEVAGIAKPYGEVAVIVAYLHDVIEDTDVSAECIEKVFGSFVAACVLILSDEPGANRKNRKTATYQKMALVEGEKCLALLVKAADRLANMRACIRSRNQKLLDLYKSEYAVFRSSAYRENNCEDIWAELEALQNS